MLKSAMASPIDYKEWHCRMHVVWRWSNSNKILQCYKQYIDMSSFSREMIHAAHEACGTNLETKTDMPEEKKDDDSTPVC